MNNVDTHGLDEFVNLFVSGEFAVLALVTILPTFTTGQKEDLPLLFPARSFTKLGSWFTIVAILFALFGRFGSSGDQHVLTFLVMSTFTISVLVPVPMVLVTLPTTQLNEIEMLGRVITLYIRCGPITNFKNESVVKLHRALLALFQIFEQSIYNHDMKVIHRGRLFIETIYFDLHSSHWLSTSDKIKLTRCLTDEVRGLVYSGRQNYSSLIALSECCISLLSQSKCMAGDEFHNVSRQTKIYTEINFIPLIRMNEEMAIAAYKAGYIEQARYVLSLLKTFQNDPCLIDGHQPSHTLETCRISIKHIEGIFQKEPEGTDPMVPHECA
ncbi:MAG: hypothetical protein ABSF91_11565 [Bacteroidota bacterium]